MLSSLWHCLLCRLDFAIRVDPEGSAFQPKGKRDRALENLCRCAYRRTVAEQDCPEGQSKHQSFEDALGNARSQWSWGEVRLKTRYEVKIPRPH